MNCQHRVARQCGCLHKRTIFLNIVRYFIYIQTARIDIIHLFLHVLRIRIGVYCQTKTRRNRIINRSNVIIITCSGFHYKTHLAHIIRNSIRYQGISSQAIPGGIAYQRPGTIPIRRPILFRIRIQVSILCMRICTGTDKHINFQHALQLLLFFFRQGIGHFPYPGPDRLHFRRYLRPCDWRDFTGSCSCPMKRQRYIHKEPVYRTAFILRLIQQILHARRTLDMDICCRDNRLLIRVYNGTARHNRVNTGRPIRFPKPENC